MGQPPDLQEIDKQGLRRYASPDSRGGCPYMDLQESTFTCEYAHATQDLFPHNQKTIVWGTRRATS